MAVRIPQSTGACRRTGKAAHRYEGTGAAGRKAEGACLIGRTADSRTGEGYSDSCGAAGSYGGTTEASAG